jgi:lipopolysaccharide transport system permease protein
MVRYRQTLMGVAWAVLQPVLLMTVFTIFFGILGRMPSNGLPYPAFFLMGLVPWQMVAKILNQGSASVTANAALVTRVYFPRTFFPASVAISSLVDFAASGAALLAVLLLFGVIPTTAVIVLPLLIVVAWILGLGLAFWLSAINVAYRDVTQLLPFLTQLGMFASPIIYPVSIVPPTLQWLYFLNPMALVVTGFRWSLGGADAPPLEAWLLGTSVATLIFVTGFVFFRQREPTFADML